MDTSATTIDVLMENPVAAEEELEEDDSQAADATTSPDDEEEEEETKSVANPEEDTSTVSTPIPTVAPKKKRGKPQIPASARKGRAPAVKGLHIPFRTVKKAMKVSTIR